MKGGIYDSREVLQTYSNVLWAYQLSSNISNNNEWDSIGLDQYWGSSEICWQCNCKDRRRRGIWWGGRESNKKVDRK